MSPEVCEMFVDTVTVLSRDLTVFYVYIIYFQNENVFLSGIYLVCKNVEKVA